MHIWNWWWTLTIFPCTYCTWLSHLWLMDSITSRIFWLSVSQGIYLHDTIHESCGCMNSVDLTIYLSYFMLRSAVGKTHVLRSRLVMDYTTSYFPLIVFGYPSDSTLQDPFRESLVFRLYSEIDHLHLSSEAQCVSHLLPLGDCHILTSIFILMSSESITRSEPTKLHVKHMQFHRWFCQISIAKVVNFNQLTIAWYEKHVTLY